MKRANVTWPPSAAITSAIDEGAGGGETILPRSSGDAFEQPAEIVQRLGANDSGSAGEDVGRNAGDRQPGGLSSRGLACDPVCTARELPAEANRIQPYLLGQSGQYLDITDVLGAGEIGREEGPMELRVLSGLPGEFAGFDGETRVGQQARRFKGQSQFHAPLALALLTPNDTRTEQALEQYALRRGLGVDLVADPGVFERELFFQLIDNTRADVAVGSYVVGEDPDLDGPVVHLYHLPQSGSAAPACPCTGVPSLFRGLSEGPSRSCSSASSTPSRLREHG